MAKVLYIKASPRGDRSKSLAVAEAFLETYRETNPNDEIETLDLFDDVLIPFDGNALNVKYRILHSEKATDEERRAWQPVEGLIEQFKSADKHVLACPMWNFHIPYRFKQYLDIIVQPSYTFTIEDGQYKGLVTGKPLFVASARGGDYSEGSGSEAYDFQKPYIQGIFQFMGFTDIRFVAVQPTLMGGPDATKKKLDEAIEQARKIAKEF
jgi:FMN-dependent NADH-azoreductase